MWIQAGISRWLGMVYVIVLNCYIRKDTTKLDAGKFKFAKRVWEGIETETGFAKVEQVE